MKPVDQHQVLETGVFTYSVTKGGKVFLDWRGKQVKILSGQAAQSFLDRITGLEPLEAQLLMAKLTGNFKRGNERDGKTIRGNL